MVTTIDLNEQEIADLKTYIRQNDVAAAVRTAMNEYLCYARRVRLKELSSKVETHDDASEQNNPS